MDHEEKNLSVDSSWRMAWSAKFYWYYAAALLRPSKGLSRVTKT